MIENYNVWMRKAIVTNMEFWVTMPDITVWQIKADDSGKIYTAANISDEEMGTLDLFASNTIKYTVKVADAANGKVTADSQAVRAGETVTLKSTADTGYVLGNLKVYGEKLEGNTFECKVGGGILVEDTYVATETNPPTGDGTVWIALLAVTALAGAAVLMLHRKKA